MSEIIQKFQGPRRTLCFLFQGALPKIGVPRATGPPLKSNPDMSRITVPHREGNISNQ